MTLKLQTRLGAFVGLGLAAMLAVWWLGSTRLALNQGGDTGRVAVDALQALWLTRALALALSAPRVAALHGTRAGAVAAWGLVAPAWPLVVLVASASTAPWLTLALAEGLLLLAGGGLAGAGQALRRVLRRDEFAEMAATLVGVALVAALWFTRSRWALPLS